MPDTDPAEQSPDVYLFTADEVAEKWNISYMTLATWRSEGRGPKFVRLGRSIRYRADDLQAYIDANQHQETVKGDR